ncbi:hypothetical protein DN585_18010 [Intrasporangium calvum]|nr:hypothetical protein DN585_18010 [Intrasporangium calvum]
MVGMGRTGLAVVAMSLAVGLGGCAGADRGSSGTPAPIDSQPATRTFAGGPIGDSTEPLTTPLFPLTLRRTGGIAGYDDTVVLHADGKVLVDTRSVHGRVCQLTGPEQKHLLSLLNTLRLVDASVPTAGSTAATVPLPPEGDDQTSNDAILINITDHKLRPLDLRDPSLGEVAGLVGALVADVTLSSPATTRCTTPTSPVPAPAT